VGHRAIVAGHYTGDDIIYIDRFYQNLLFVLIGKRPYLSGGRSGLPCWGIVSRTEARRLDRHLPDTAEARRSLRRGGCRAPLGLDRDSRLTVLLIDGRSGKILVTRNEGPEHVFYQRASKEVL
jgi:hypothetical protein